MKVFVTGHLGYIGAHLVDVLKASGHEVTGCDLGLSRGVEELHRSMVELGFSKEDFEGDRYVRLRMLKKHVEWMLGYSLADSSR